MIAQVILNSNAKQLNRVFDYLIPENMANNVKIGSRIFVPFGNRKQIEEAVVVGFKETSEYKLKEIIKIEEEQAISEQGIELAKWMSKRYFCHLSDCIKLMLPPGTTTKIIENRVKEKNASYLYLNKTVEEIKQEIESKKIKSEKQIRALQFLIENEGSLASDLEMFADVSKAVIQTLIKNGYIEVVQKQVERNPFINKEVQKTQNLQLTEEQMRAYMQVSDSMDDHLFSGFLLFGVTGSRKNRSIFTINTKSIRRK